MDFDFSAPLKLPDGKKLPGRAFLAPMEGVMTTAFVESADALELLDFWMPPFFPVPNEAPPSQTALRRRFEAFSAKGLPQAPQILARHPQSAATSAKRLAALGFEFISFNFACPSRSVLASGGGGALLRNPDKALAILDASTKALNGEASAIVKIRTGWSSPDECLKLLPRLRDAGAGAFIVHFRTVEEQYRRVDGGLERLAAAVEAAGNTPLIGNGDIKSVDDARAMIEKCACAGNALARGFLSDPFLIRRIKGLSSPSKEEGARLFIEELRRRKGPRGNVLELTKAAYGEDSAEFRKELGSIS